MSLLRSERAAALFLFGAAVVGLLVANSPLAGAIDWMRATHFALPFTGVDLSVQHWISDGLLAVFFFVAAVELRHELTVGQLNSLRRATAPAIAAAGGILVPALVYLAVAGGAGYAGGWPIPTATDIAFALGILAMFGRGLAPGLRAFMLALAILDDIVAIVVIALFFTDNPQFGFLLAAAACLGLVALLSRLRPRSRAVRMVHAAALLVLAVAIWVLVVHSGVHPTIAGVALGLLMAPRLGDAARHRLEPVSNGLVLPLFAFSAAAVTLPQLALGELAAPFWAILLALPLGKLVGIGLGALLATRVGPAESRPRMDAASIVAAGALGGVGFTVSLLMNELAFAGDRAVADQGILAVLLGSSVSIVAGSVLVASLARRARHTRTE